MSGSLKLKVSYWAIGELSRRALPGIALKAIISGVDGPSLRALAGTHEEDESSSEALWVSSLVELGIAVPALKQAAADVAIDLCRQIGSGNIEVESGVRMLSGRVWQILEPLEQIRKFKQLDSELDDLDRRRDNSASGQDLSAQWEIRVRSAADALLEYFASGSGPTS